MHFVGCTWRGYDTYGSHIESVRERVLHNVGNIRESFWKLTMIGLEKLKGLAYITGAKSTTRTNRNDALYFYAPNSWNIQRLRKKRKKHERWGWKMNVHSTIQQQRPWFKRWKPCWEQSLTLREKKIASNSAFQQCKTLNLSFVLRNILSDVLKLGGKPPITLLLGIHYGALCVLCTCVVWSTCNKANGSKKKTKKNHQSHVLVWMKTA